MKKFKVLVNGEPFEVQVEEMQAVPPAPSVKLVSSRPAASPPPAVQAAPAAPEPVKTAPAPPPPAAPAGAGAVTAPMPGNINAVKVKPGDQVKAGDPLVVLEAMKMENEITAPVAGTVEEVRVKAGQTVNNGDVLVVIG
ncbi:biotin/lipoyl-binding protein [Desulfofundulus thermobenzoicus]|uniref:Biotin/lipoyl-binding protein n=1 Tax=Desulfofundulus thermobenzoicus TaxID=29376 RepID=A0A6N7IQT5_9FIRM|nr:biotin/lipoyl-containing protein [Desulfofundulus thermobenzoicus]MQL52404.1 biotin/lipoyl-binding protein [Desulfofundulus thermobenzoicus]HHW43001.1 biotin/lipoyl-binding protein [Desulfotomaculum sp.]